MRSTQRALERTSRQVRVVSKANQECQCAKCGDTGIKSVGIDYVTDKMTRIRCDCPKGQKRRGTKHED